MKINQGHKLYILMTLVQSITHFSQSIRSHILPIVSSGDVDPHNNDAMLSSAYIMYAFMADTYKLQHTKNKKIKTHSVSKS